MNDFNIGLALSGGGMRAAVFHLGALRFLAEKKLLENIKYISTVSGGTLLVGLIYHSNEYNWPTSEIFLSNIHPDIKKTITGTNLQVRAILRYIINPFNWLNGRCRTLSRSIFTDWGIKELVNKIPVTPVWAINCTTQETGNRWRIKNDNMGDYTIGYISANEMKLADVMAISAAYPPHVGPYRIYIKKYEWFDYLTKERTHPRFKHIDLIDGGLYDNLGMEPLYDIGKNSIKETDPKIDFLIVSDAGQKFKIRSSCRIVRIKRMFDILMSQVRRLRVRNLVNFFIKEKKGLYLQMGSCPEDIISRSGRSYSPPTNFLDKNDIERIATHQTNLCKMKIEAFDNIERHGYETAKLYYELYVADGQNI